MFCAGQETFRRDNPDSDKPLTAGMYFPFPLHGCAHSREKRIHRSRSARGGNRYRNEALLLRRSRSGDIRQPQSQPWRCALPRSEQKQHRNDKDRRNPLRRWKPGFLCRKGHLRRSPYRLREFLRHQQESKRSRRDRLLQKR